ncbi:uncharacterized protein LOC6534399 [Drosophila yakuba]|uniref:Uncharacterized protein n=1 Tax=Drosophila yakuba TaxID=7245 RepID=B4PK91_DROYA|nr:uncharacterized protein LOC6534399 [Drosophila yakuba]EDW94789.1 uncharacterized protein Dyak_GE19879 [Drosophila yakuba]
MMTCFLSRVLSLGRCGLQVFQRRMGHFNHCTLALATVDLVCIVCLLHYQLARHGRDLFFWCEELNQRLVEYMLSAIVLMASVSVLGSCVDGFIFSALVQRKMSQCDMPRQFFEDRYRRFVFMRLVRQLEQALKVQAKQSELGDRMMTPLANLSEAQQLITEAIDEFRTAVRILLWPNRSDLLAEAFVLFHISESQLSDLTLQGYKLNDVDGDDMSNSRLSHMLNPLWY